ncbi:MAG TPA: hypothetical protein VMT37_02765 [Solirubrobacterales bacterium]|nr:hypothetical protein [Solirubrobacterales bacterium]
MKTSQTQRSHLARRALAALTALAATAALAAGLGSAAASASEVPAALLGPSVNVSFTRQSANLVGDSAVVAVKCKGPQGSSCTGTVALHLGGATHKASFYVQGGVRQNVIVPLGADGEAAAGRRARAVAETVQPLGAPRESERLLRLK